MKDATLQNVTTENLIPRNNTREARMVKTRIKEINSVMLGFSHQIVVLITRRSGFNCVNMNTDVGIIDAHIDSIHTQMRQLIYERNTLTGRLREVEPLRQPKKGGRGAPLTIGTWLGTIPHLSEDARDLLVKNSVYTLERLIELPKNVLEGYTKYRPELFEGIVRARDMHTLDNV